MNVSSVWPYHTTGESHKLPVVFLHGFMGTGADWLPIAKRCAGHFFCILPDLPGHGNNTNLPFAQQLNFDNVVAGLQQLLAQLALERVNLVGYSMGGRIALYAATRFPQKINALVLESTNPGLADPQARRARAKVDNERAERLLQAGLDVFVDRWYELTLFSSLKKHPLLFEQTKAKRKQNDPRWTAKIISELSPGRQPPLWDKLGLLPMPVLLLTGALDSKYADLMATMGQRILDATVEIIPEAGHNIHLEQPEIFAERVAAFLRRY